MRRVKICSKMVNAKENAQVILIQEIKIQLQLQLGPNVLARDQIASGQLDALLNQTSTASVSEQQQQQPIT